MSRKIIESNKLEDMAKQEKKLAKVIQRLAGSIRSDAVRSMLEVMALDSERHAKLYDSAADILDPARKMISAADLNRISDEVENHIREEAQHLEEVKKLSEAAKDPRLRTILNVILDDEIRHHKLFQTLREAIMSEETIQEEDLWNRMWDPSIWMREQI